jgi:periplasmic protein TonB
MRRLELDDRFEPGDASRRLKGIVIVVVLHALVGYALVSGLHREGLNLMTKPLEAVVIQEVSIAPPRPPPPPPRKIEKPREIAKANAAALPYVPLPEVAPQVSSMAPAIESVATLPPAPAVIAAAPPSAQAPVAIEPRRASIGLVCPGQVAPEMPRRALREGIEGVVKAQVHVKGGKVVQVTILSGPAVFHAAVKAAMLQYRCVADGDEVVATQVFNFKVE